MRVALGWKAHSGWAALVALGGDLREPRLVERSRVELVPAGEPWARAPFHAADELGGEAGRKLVERGIASVNRRVPEAMREAVARAASDGHEVCGCGVLIGSGLPSWTIDEIRAVHFRMHKAEGELFREALVAGASACELPLATLPDKSALEAAVRELATTRVRLDDALAALGKQAGAPWGKDQKEAAAAAFVALSAAASTATTRAKREKA